jgi:hypothetical protein
MPAAIVGRERELRRLDAFLHQAANAPSALVLQGEDEIGQAERRIGFDELRQPPETSRVLGSLLPVRGDENVDVRSEQLTRPSHRATKPCRPGRRPTCRPRPTEALEYSLRFQQGGDE